MLLTNAVPVLSFLRLPPKRLIGACMIKHILLAWSLLWFGSAYAAPPMPTVDYVDLPRFMGEWYVIANIPTALEKGAHNPLKLIA